MNHPKLCILGHCRHGKDTLAEILRDEFGTRFTSSSEASAKIFIHEQLKDKYNYSSLDECFVDRINHRQEWYEMICNYNKKDKARLAKEILVISNCYVGMRDFVELEECKRQNLFDLIIWVDASKRLPLEDSTSFNIDKIHADIIMDNNGSLGEFREKVIRLGTVL